MAGLRRFLLRLAHFLRVRQPDAHVRREIDAHVGVVEDAYVARGMTREAARRAALIAVGGRVQAEERHRDARSFAWLEDARQDCLQGARLLRRSPLFTVTAVLSIAIGIGGNIAIFGIVNQLLFRVPPGVAQTEGLVSIGTAREDGGLNPLPADAYDELTRQASSFESLAGHQLAPHVMSLEAGGGYAERVLAEHVTASFFGVLGVRSSVGRVLLSPDDDAGGVVVLQHEYWARRFASDPAVVGRVVYVNGQAVSIVGIAAPLFEGAGLQRPDLWIAMRSEQRRGGGLMGIGRLRPGVAMAAATGEAARIGVAISRSSAGAHTAPVLRVLSFSRAEGNRNVIAFLALALMALVSLVFGVGCANVAGILLARSSARTREMALRAALGAGRGRLVRQLLAETTLLSLLAGGVGLALARAIVRLVRLIPGLSVPGDAGAPLDWRVLLFTLSVAFVAALASGLIRALCGSGAAPIETLKDAGPSSSPRQRMRGLFVTGQVAIAVLFVVMAGLFLRALRYAGATDRGFDARNVQIGLVDLSMAAGARVADSEFWHDVLDRLEPLTAVDAASVAMVPPGGWEGINLGRVSAAEQATSRDLFPSWNIVGPRYFATLRIPIVAGRDFTWSDSAGAPPVVIVAEAVVRRLWPGEAGVGKRLRVETFVAGSPDPEKRVATVVGVVADIKTSSVIDGMAEPYVYSPVAQGATSGMTRVMSIVARSHAGKRLDREIAAIVRSRHPGLVIARSETLEDAVAFGLAPQRLFTDVTAALGFLSVLLASMGIYGVVGYTVACQRQELAIRMALGASRRQVLWAVISPGMALAVAGSAIGLLLAAAVSRVLSAFLYGLPALHAPTFVTAVASVALAAAVASYLPARRAVHADPLNGLRTN